MTYKIFSRLIVAMIVLSSMIYAASEIYKKEKGNKYYEVVASGNVAGKFESDYACGAKGRYTCYSRYLIIDEKKHSVNLETFTKTRIGDHVVLKMEKTEDSSQHGYMFLFFLFGMFIWVALVLFIIYLLFMFVIWSMFHSDNIKFSDFICD